MASFPLVSCGFMVFSPRVSGRDRLQFAAQHANSAGLRANEEADPAAGAAVAQIDGRVVAIVVQLFGQAQHLGRTGLHTETTALALFGDRKSTRLNSSHLGIS